MYRINVNLSSNVILYIVASIEIQWMDFETRMRKMIGQLLSPVLEQQQADSEVVMAQRKDMDK